MKRHWWINGLLALGALLMAAPGATHHSFAAEFDAENRTEISGIVTNVRWTNPHVWVYINVTDAEGEVVNWGFEMGPPHALQRRGWRRDTLKIGEEVTVEGALARDGSKRLNASRVILASTGGEPGAELDPGSSE